MSQKFSVNDFKWVEDISELDEIFMKIYNEKSDEGYFLEVDIQYLANLHNLHSDLPFETDRMKIEKVEKHVANLHDKTEYVIQIKNLKQALNYGLVLKKLNRVIKFNQKTWLKPCIDTIIDLIKKQRRISKRILFKLMNNADKLVTTEKKKNLFGIRTKLSY